MAGCNPVTDEVVIQKSEAGFALITMAGQVHVALVYVTCNSAQYVRMYCVHEDGC
jgi:hypothetical protein